MLVLNSSWSKVSDQVMSYYNLLTVTQYLKISGIIKGDIYSYFIVHLILPPSLLKYNDNFWKYSFWGTI